MLLSLLDPLLESQSSKRTGFFYNPHYVVGVIRCGTSKRKKKELNVIKWVNEVKTNRKDMNSKKFRN